MKISMMIRSLILFLFLIILGCSNPKEEDDEQHLGIINLAVSGDKEAIPHFEKGLLLLHSFEFVDAAESFIEAQKIDPEFVMAYWGEAMTYNHPLWRQQNYEKGVEALMKLSGSPSGRKLKAMTELEANFLHSTEILYGEGNKFERDSIYSNYMGQLYNKYPDNQEIAAFYALSLLGTVHNGRNDEIFEKGARIAQSILDENPNHPGALHYTIHSYDDPFHAFKALEAANSYSQIAKDASHALHMPSHIYVALGMWDKVVASNVDAWQASVDRMHRKGLSNNAQSYHAFYWLMYGYLQQNNFVEAKKIMHDMVKYTEELPSAGARDYLVNMKGTYLTETNDWNGELVSLSAETSDLNISTQGILLFTKGISGYTNKNKEEIKNAINVMKEIRLIAETNVSNIGSPLCGLSGQNYKAPNQLDIDQLHIMELELLAMYYWMQGDLANTELKLLEATNLEKSISYSYGPPTVVKPSHELYGDWLLETNKYKEAAEMYQRSLERNPKRLKSMIGLLQATEALGDSQASSEIKRELDKIIQSPNKDAQRHQTFI